MVPVPLSQQVVGRRRSGVGAGSVGRALQGLLQAFCRLQYAQRVGLADARSTQKRPAIQAQPDRSVRRSVADDFRCVVAIGNVRVAHGAGPVGEIMPQLDANAVIAQQDRADLPCAGAVPRFVAAHEIAVGSRLPGTAPHAAESGV